MHWGYDLFVKGLPYIQIASGEPDVPEDFHQQVSDGAPGPSRHSHSQKGTPVTHFSELCGMCNCLLSNSVQSCLNFLVYLKFNSFAKGVGGRARIHSGILPFLNVNAKSFFVNN